MASKRGITRKCGMCGDPVLISNSGAQNRRCASCQQRYVAICRDLGTPVSRRIDRALAQMRKPVEAKPSDGSHIQAALDEMRRVKYEPLTEIDKMLQEIRFLAERKARAVTKHEQWREALLVWGAGTGA